MREFLHFWWQNILISWRIGYGVFAIIEAISVIGAAIFRLRAKTSVHREKWEDVTMKIAALVLMISFLISTFCIAPFLQYDKANAEMVSQKEQRERAEKERDNAKADLSAATKSSTGQPNNSQTAIEHKRELRDKLSEFLEDGQHWLAVCEKPQGDIFPGDQIDKWAVELDRYVQRELGRAYVVRLKSTEGLLPISPAGGVKEPCSDQIWHAIHVRCERLNQFIEELSK